MKHTRWIALLLAVCMVLSWVPAVVQAAEVTSGTVDARSGEFTWKFSKGTLTLTGEGYCIDDCPWEHLKDRIESIVFDGSLKIIGDAFSDMPNLTRVVFPDNLGRISYAFKNCTSLESVVIPSSCDEISNSFNHCYQLSSVTLPANLESIYYSFYATYCLLQITIPNKTEKIGSSFGLSGLQNITIPQSVIYLGSSFNECYYLREICILGNAPESEGTSFRNVTATVYYPKSNYTWTDSARNAYPETLTWNGVTNPANVKMSYDPYWSIHDGVLTITGSGDMKEETPWINANPIITKIVIDEGITSIPESTFYRTEVLKEVDLPNTLTKISNQAFDSSGIERIVIPDNVTDIGESAFRFCENLKHVVLPAHLKELNKAVFVRCTSLTEITLPQGLTRIGESALQDCRNLSKITIPAAVTSIDRYAFAGCYALEEIHFEGDAPTLGEFAFNNVTATAYYHADKEGWTELVENYQGTVNWQPYHTHSHTSSVVAPTCTEQGYTLYTCNCGDSYKENFVAALGHKGDALVFDKTAKNHAGKCDVCGEQISESCTFDAGTVVSKPTKDKFGITKYTCKVCGGSYEYQSVYRVFGADRCRTAIAAAEELKKVLGVKKFDAIILASGEGFADALAGSYLAVKKNAPILLVQTKNIDLNKNYILDNLAEGGTVYILGGPVAVPTKMEDALKGLNVVRLQGATRIETNLLILEEAGIKDEEILICTGWEFADSLSASATGLPILMLNPKKNVLTDGQRAFLQKHSDNNYTIIGGNAAISQKLEADVEAIVGETYRVAGAAREVTSVMVAKRYFTNADYAVVAYSRNFPDGLCGGPLAHALNAPMLLVDARKESYAADYIKSQAITKGFALGGTAAVSEASVQKVFLSK